jgi:hypothetical protein
LEKNKLELPINDLINQKYNLILLFRYLHKPLFKIIPKILQKGGFFFCETFMSKNGKGKLTNVDQMLISKELVRLETDNFSLIKFYEGENSKKKHLIQSAIFKKL